MNTETLFYKEHVVSGNSLEIIFHKDYTYLFNETDSLPVVKFSLINCTNLLDIEFENIDYYNDGIIAAIKKEFKKNVFEMTDMGGIETQISCDKVVREDLEYRQSDLIDIIKSTKKESVENNERANMFNNRLEGLTNTLKHDLDIIQRKLEQANWITIDKKQFLEGQQNIIHKILQVLTHHGY